MASNESPSVDSKTTTIPLKAKTSYSTPSLIPSINSGGCPFMNNQDVEYTDCYYHDYLQLDKILNANHPRSSEYLPSASHDEHLFITIHQSYELWFKQILYELDSNITYLGRDILDDREMLKIVSRFQRINRILKLLVEQFTILDTMTPMNFLDFRKYLKPASGFQSIQFRLLENKLGLEKRKRMRYNKKEYTAVLTEEHQQILMNAEREREKETLFCVLEKWLERFPYLKCENWSFWKEYKSAVNDYIIEEKQLYLSNAKVDTSEQHIAQLKKELDKAYNKHIETFACIFDEEKYCELRRERKVRLSYTALQAALMIMLYREEPVLQMPFRILEVSMDLDNLLTQWRNAHALMVHRMLGSKMGTGGSSGFHYLRTAAVHHKVFADFFNLSTYMIPKSNLPKLPNYLKFYMDFASSTTHMRRVPASASPLIVKRDKGFVVKDSHLPFPTLNRSETFSPNRLSNTLKNEMKKKKEEEFENESFEFDGTFDVD